MEMDLTLSKIETMQMGELFKIAKDLDIKADTAWELKQRLSVYAMKKKGSIIDLSGYTASVMQEKELTIVEDEKRRAELEVYLGKIKEIYSTIMLFKKIQQHIKGENLVVECDDPLISFIKNEMKTVGEDFEKMAELVKTKPKCTLLICGDSGAGKSSFINLLIGDGILPTSIRSNSACQVRLTYGEPERAEIVDLNSKLWVIQRDQFKDELSKFLESYEDRDKVSCNLATIYLKSVILEGGLDIYDTIGLGETEMFNNELKKELNQITGIIFLLKKNNPIGDTTIGGLSEIIHQLVLKGLPWGSMNFIINMCDLLQGTKEKEDLRNNVIEQLQDKCTLISPLVRTFSTKQELYFQHNNVMSTDYKEIIQLIHQLHISSINTNTVKVFSFLLKFVQQTIDQINELEKYAASGKAERKEYILQLRNLEYDRKRINWKFSTDNRKYLVEEKKGCRKKVEDYFRKGETRNAVVQAVLDRQTELYGKTKIDDINQRIEELSHEEISKNFKAFIENKGILKSCCDKMLKTFMQQFMEHEKKKENIHKAMNRHIEIVMGGIECNFNDIITAQAQSKGFLHLISPILVPILIIKNSIEKANWFSTITAIFNKRNIQTFYGDTSTYVTREASARYSSYLGKSSNLTKLMECLFKAPEQVTNDFEKYLSEDMDYLAKNIKLLDDDMRQQDIVFETYKEIKGQLQEIHEEICHFSLLRLHKEKKHIMRKKIQLSTAPGTEIDDDTLIVKGRNRLVYRGKVEDDVITESCIMVYKSEDGKTWRQWYDEFRLHNEVSSLKLRNEFVEISKCFLDLERHVIFDMDYQGELAPTFLVSEIESSLRAYIVEKRSVLLHDESTDGEKALYIEICRLLKQILKGLEYLHSNMLVHYDLTVDSIGYSSCGTVKLTSVSLPTKVKVDYEKDSVDYVINMAHLPIHVLDPMGSGMYDATSDIYCLGILIYTMWLNLHPFFTIITNAEIRRVCDFVSIAKKDGIDALILNEMFNHSFAQFIYAWSCQCRDGKITLAQFLRELEIPRFLGTKTD